MSFDYHNSSFYFLIAPSVFIQYLRTTRILFSVSFEVQAYFSCHESNRLSFPQISENRKILKTFTILQQNRVLWLIEKHLFLISNSVVRFTIEGSSLGQALWHHLLLVQTERLGTRLKREFVLLAVNAVHASLEFFCSIRLAFFTASL